MIFLPTFLDDVFRIPDIQRVKKHVDLRRSGIGLSEHELCGHLAGEAGNEAYPLRTEGIGEEDWLIIPSDESDGLVLLPSPVAQKVDLNLHRGALL